ncbi:Aspartate racemase [Fulvivirga imtechensis AK7]|uniref:Aspartate racemase n=1 Tax=Fulvivirga imtechensis AK7 TaxID=1237149 RepID=L8JIU1_9BACT|nr:amino acid racemase [Fulvivirga imtechensis]ELR68781.1 Aspartate racemase [Fulvivirga imtechensis AK7]
MVLENSKVIGIVGGMGPRAGVNLYDRLISLTPANIDQEHPSVILMAFPWEIGDRTSFLEGKISTNPGYSIAQVIKKLTISGAEIIGIACNTSHSPAIFNVIKSEMEKLDAKPKLLHMPLEVYKYISTNSNVSRIGIMATNGTYKTRLYQEILHDGGYEVIVPDPIFQNEVIHRMIYDAQFGIKAKPNTITKEVGQLWNEAMCFFRARNCDTIILGCTELSLLLKDYGVDDMCIIDSTDCLAKGLLREMRPCEATKLDTKVKDLNESW